MAIRTLLVLVSFAFSFPVVSYGEECRFHNAVAGDDSESGFVAKINQVFSSMAALGKGCLPSKPLKIFLRPLFHGSNLRKDGLPFFGSLSAIEERAVHDLSNVDGLSLSSADEEAGFSLNLNCSIQQLRGGSVAFWELEFMKEFPLASSPNSVGLEAPIWKDCRMQFFKTGETINDGRWAALDDLLGSFCK